MGFTENILKSLTKEELRLVEKNAFDGKDSQARKLFDLSVKFGEEEEKIAVRFKKAAPNGNIAIVRNQLSQILLDSSYQIHATENEWAEVNKLIVQIDFFIKKSSFEVVKKLLKKALLLAAENEFFTQQIDLLEMTIQLFQARVLLDKEERENTIQLLQTTWAKKQNHISYQLLLSEQMELLNQNFTIRTPEGLAKFEQIMNDPLMHSEEHALCVKSKLDFWIIKGQFFSISNKYDLAADAFEHIIALLDVTPAIKKQRNLAYLSLCAQLATYGYILQRPELMQKAIKAIHDTEKHNEIERIAAATFIINSNMAYYDFIKDKTGLKQTISEAHELLKQHIEKIKPDVQATLMIACVSGYAEFGEYEKLLEMMREFSEFIFSNIRVDMKATLFFYELIAQIETGNEQMVYDTIQNFNRYLLRHDFKGEFEQIMIQFLKIISSNTNTLKEELTKLKDQLTALPQKSILNQNRVLFQILTNMVDSKIAGKKFHEYLEEGRV